MTGNRTFKQVVHFDKIQAYNGVNLLHGYRPVGVFSLKEVVEP